MAYVDGFVLAVPDRNRERVRTMADRIAEVFIDHGALRVVENWGDDVPDGTRTDLRRAVALEPGETVVFSWVEWPSREARDRGNAAIATDPRTVPTGDDGDIMDPGRMIFGGFKTLVERAPHKGESE